MLDGRASAALQLLDRQLLFARGTERGWALILRGEIDFALDQPEAGWADYERASKAFGNDPAGRFASRLRTLDRLTRRHDPAVPNLVAELQRAYSPTFPERERVRYWINRFSYEVMRGNTRDARQLLGVALAQATLPDLRTTALRTKISLDRS